MASTAPVAVATLFLVFNASAQERVRIPVPGMPEHMKPEVIDSLKNNSVPMPAPAPAPAGAAASNNGTDPFHPATTRSNSAPSVNYGSQPATTTTFSKEQYEYLKNNAVTMQPVPQQGTSSNSSIPAQSSNIFIGSQVTGFGAPKAGDIIFLPSTKNPSKLEAVSTSVLNFYSSQPARILLDTAKATGSGFAPSTPVIGMLKGGAMGADIISAGQKGGNAAAWDKSIEKSFVMGSQAAGSIMGGPVGGAAAGGVAQASYSTGKAIEPWLDSKLKMSDKILWIDQRFDISRDAKALQQSQQAVAKLQEQVNAARAKPDLKSFGVTANDVKAAKQAPQKSASMPTKNDFDNAPGKAKGAVAPAKPEPAPAPYQASAPARAPVYRAPAVNCAQLQQQLYANARSGSLGALCQIEDQLARYCGGPRGNACGGGGGFGGLGGFRLPF